MVECTKKQKKEQEQPQEQELPQEQEQNQSQWHKGQWNEPRQKEEAQQYVEKMAKIMEKFMKLESQEAIGLQQIEDLREKTAKLAQNPNGLPRKQLKQLMKEVKRTTRETEGCNTKVSEEMFATQCELLQTKFEGH